jgi:hypothetical protein
MKFGETDLDVISNALRVAAERFDENAKVFAETQTYIAEQFTRQASEARRIYDSIASQTSIAS